MAPTPYPTWPPTSPTHTVAGVKLWQHPRSSSSPPLGRYQSMGLPRAPAPPPSEAETSGQPRMRESPASASTCSPPSTQRGRDATPSRARSAGAPASGSSGTASGFWTTPAGLNLLQQGTLQVAPSLAGTGCAATMCAPQHQQSHATHTARPGTPTGTAGQPASTSVLLPYQRPPPPSSASPATGWSAGLGTNTPGKPIQSAASTAPPCSQRTTSRSMTPATSSSAWCYSPQTCPHHHLILGDSLILIQI